MNRSSYVIRLTGQDIDGSSISCLGSHLKKILQILTRQAQEYCWFIADVDAYQLVNTFVIYKSPEPKLIGDIKQLMSLSENVDQFLSGVFLAVPVGLSPVHWTNSFFTEREPFDNMDRAVLEIRAFDTTFLEIYAKRKELLLDLANEFQSKIICS